MKQKYLINTGKYGFLDEVYEVRILLCYLIKHSPSPLTHDNIFEIATKNDLINYFYLEDALCGLVELGYAKTQEAKDGNSYYTLTENGESIAKEFQRYIPKALRDRIIDEAVSLFNKIKREKEVKCKTVKLENGYELQFTLLSGETVIMKLKMFTPDISSAKYFTKKIEKDPSAFYKYLIDYLTDGYKEVKLKESPLDNI